MISRFIVIVIVIFWFSGCAHVISKGILREIDTKITFTELRKAPKAYLNKVVLLGGVIVKTVNKKDGTLIEVYQTEIDREGRPTNIDVSSGRFLAHYNGFVDSEIYSQGRKVTIAGVITGEQTMRVGEVDYHYPYIIIKEIYLWKKEKPIRYEPYPYGVWYPWWWYPRYPYHDPYRPYPYY